MKSFKELKKIKIKAKKKNQESPEPVNTQKKKDPDDSALFYSFMAQVKPLKGSGRDITVETSVPEKSRVREDDNLEALHKLVRGEIEFDIQYSEEYIQGYVQGINSRIFRRFKNGELSIEGHLDLHGYNSDQARAELLRFLRDEYIQNKKCVLVIPGRGKNSPMGSGVLRKEIQIWLTIDPLKRIVLAFSSALPKHGGTGALYILLRSHRKNSGKIYWDKYLLGLDP